MSNMASILRSPAIACALVVLSACGLASCRGTTSEDPPILLLRNMWHQQRYDHQNRSGFFADHRVMRTPPAGTVAQENFEEDERLTTGLDSDGTSYVLSIPDAIVERAHGMPALLARGRERFGIFCTPCHGDAGDGRGIVPVRSGARGYNFPEPPTFHSDRLRHAPDGQMFAVITNGVRAMPGYAAQIPMQDRWAIVSYMRALQLTQSSNTATAEARP